MARQFSRGLLDASRSAAFAQIMDRDAVVACVAAGVGSDVDAHVGGTSRRAARPARRR